MIEEETTLTKYERYEQIYERRWARREPRPEGRPSKGGLPGKAEGALVELTDDLADPFGAGPRGPAFTYQPSRFESGWLMSSLASFYDQALIADVLTLVKGGKEAHVYVCQGAGEDGGGTSPLLAAKVYRPRMFRNLRNDKIYREGREILTAEGKAAGKAAGTIARAIRNKSAFGMEARHVSWLSHEYAALQTLYAAGAAVPRPVASNDNAVLMGYCGDERRAAPVLHSVRLRPGPARRLLDEVLHNVDLMLEHDVIHGDLSAYNILYWEGRITIIDLPQVVNPHANRNAYRILERDLARTCEYFCLQGATCDAGALAAEMWRRHMGDVDPEKWQADWSRIDTDQ